MALIKVKDLGIQVWHHTNTQTIGELQIIGDRVSKILEGVFPQLKEHSAAIDGGRLIEFEVNGKYPKLDDIRLLIYMMGYECNVWRINYTYNDNELS